ncbi:MAG: xanthine dehydrogenase family protein molybdopterin-binding subunit, partial [Methylococcaceae bacterium]|nr:xanthine dehydrogenase family protein molybdopterin-binding subunit [Methylococcaceae bacterium]
MNDKMLDNASRREFLRHTLFAGGGLLLASYIDPVLASPRISKPSSTAAAGFKPSVFIHIATDGKVTLISKQPEIGQGIKTALPMVIAEELEVNWQDVSIVQGDLDDAYGSQSAGGSRSTPTNYDEFLHLGASARTLLVAAAAQIWQLPAAELLARDSAVHHPATGRKLGYGELAETAAQLPLPDFAEVKRKDPKDYRLLGTRVGGVDNIGIVTGKPLFGIDVQLPGLGYAIYEKSPVFGGKVVSANVEQIRRLPGVRAAFIIKG